MSRTIMSRTNEELETAIGNNIAQLRAMTLALSELSDAVARIEMEQKRLNKLTLAQSYANAMLTSALDEKQGEELSEKTKEILK